MSNKKKIFLEPILIFIIIILSGGILLMLPISNQEPIRFMDSLFTSVSAVCVTGFSTVIISEQFSFIGQVIITILAQIGALRFLEFDDIYIKYEK